VAVCAQCHEENPEQARFCLSCGAPLERGAMEERKVITVLFADLVDFTARAEHLDPEDVRRLLTPYYARVRAELERFGGTVEKFIGDAVMAVFGAPVAHEDDPERAVRAAFAIRDALAELNAADDELDLHLRVGVNTGEAHVALDARLAEGQPMATGDVINTASRLETSAPVEGILVGEATYRATADAIEYRKSEPLTLKGKSAPVQAWEAVAPRPRQAFDLVRRRLAPLVGREAELSALRDAVADAFARRAPRLLTLVGPPGIGKSRLAWELFHTVAADPDPPVWRHGRCLPYGEGVTFWALGEMIKAEAGILESDPVDEVSEKLAATVRRVVTDEGERQWLERHLRPLVGLGGLEAIGGERRAEAFTAWRRFVELLASRPLVLAFEDLHWADDGLLDFVEGLAAWTGEVPLAVVCTAREELLERRPGWGDAPSSTVLELPPLSRGETVSLLDELLEQHALPEFLEEAVLERAAGNPLYAAEYLSMLVDRGFLRRERETYYLRRKELPLPESLHAIIASRLDALPAGDKSLIHDASVLGRSFWGAALAAVSGARRDDVEDGLRQLARKELVRPERRSAIAGEAQYAFSHALVRDVAYAQIPRSRRAELHRRAADWIASLGDGRSEDHAEMLAHHYLSALDLARALRRDVSDLVEPARLAFRVAGDRALGLYGFPAAVRFYRAALDLRPDDADRATLLFRYGKARFWGEAAGDDELRDGSAALLAAGDVETAAEADVLRSQLARGRGERDTAVLLAEGAVALLEMRHDSHAKAAAHANLAGFLVFAGRIEEAVQVGADALAMAERLGLDDLQASALTNMGFARAATGDERGFADLERAVEIAERANSPEAVRGYVNLATLVAQQGDLRRAAELYARGQRAAERFADARGLRWFAIERLFQLYWSRDWDDADELADELLAAEAHGDPIFGCRLVRAWLRLGRGDAVGASHEAQRELALARVAQEPQLLLPALAVSARALFEAGQTVDADAAVGEALDLWRASGPAPASFWAADLAEAAVALERGGELLEIAAGVALPTRWLDAATATAAGDHARAAQLYDAIGTLPAEEVARKRAEEALAATGR
jgi:class 3 adenylate cyclase